MPSSQQLRFLWFTIGAILVTILVAGAYMQGAASCISEIQRVNYERTQRVFEDSDPGSPRDVVPEPIGKPLTYRVQADMPTPVPSAARPTAAAARRVTPEIEQEMHTLPHTKAVFEAVTKAAADPLDPKTLDVIVVPLFHDADEFRGMLESIDSPVRLFVFVCNSNDPHMLNILQKLQKMPFGVAVVHHPENAGFSGAVNEGIRKGIAMLRDPPARWFFIVNADTVFPPKALGSFATVCNSVWATHGLAYGPRQDHFAFVITRTAVDRVGMMDEVFFPGYMEDIDYHWRVHLGGLPQTITGINFHHHHSVNLHKPNTGDYRNQLVRAANGWEYGWMKWGRYSAAHIEMEVPPSGWKTPFNIPNASLSLWVVDPAHRECIRSGRGTYHVDSSTCWYNGTVMLEVLPPGTKLTPNLLRPMISGRDLQM